MGLWLYFILYFFPAVKNFLKIYPVSQKNMYTFFFQLKFLGNHGSVDLCVNNSQMYIWFKLLCLNKCCNLVAAQMLGNPCSK